NKNQFPQLGPCGLNDPIARPQPLEMLICNSAIGNSNWGIWDPAESQLRVQIPEPDPTTSDRGEPFRTAGFSNVSRGAGRPTVAGHDSPPPSGLPRANLSGRWRRW